MCHVSWYSSRQNIFSFASTVCVPCQHSEIWPASSPGEAGQHRSLSRSPQSARFKNVIDHVFVEGYFFCVVVSFVECFSKSTFNSDLIILHIIASRNCHTAEAKPGCQCERLKVKWEIILAQTHGVWDEISSTTHKMHFLVILSEQRADTSSLFRPQYLFSGATKACDVRSTWVPPILSSSMVLIVGMGAHVEWPPHTLVTRLNRDWVERS